MNSEEREFRTGPDPNNYIEMPFYVIDILINGNSTLFIHKQPTIK